MKQILPLFLAALLLASLLSGCGGKTQSPASPAPAEASPETAAPTPEPEPEPEPEPAPEPVSLATAFGDSSLEGSFSPEEVAFYSPSGEAGAETAVLSREEVLAWWNEQETLPRTHFFEPLLPECLAELYPLLDYAYANSFSRVCVPTAGFEPMDVTGGWRYLPQTYFVNGSRLGAQTVAGFELGDGKTLPCVTVTMNGMDGQGRRSEYREALAAAREIVAGIPEGSSQYDKALYLYRWLTDNVSFYSDGDYYGTDWNLLYDALIRKETVCSGYTEAMYVLFNLAGIECLGVGGAMFYQDVWGSHVWNVAKIDGDYYAFDATLDAGCSQYWFFGVSDETMSSRIEHAMMGGSENYCPPCTRDLPLP